MEPLAQKKKQLTVHPTFSKTKKKTKDLKRVHMEKVRDLVDQFRYIYVFHCENFRNELMKKAKEELNPNVLSGSHVLCAVFQQI
ncbi:hypothetical protein RFI_07048 [Reticulomyxa filosa]|uniref:Uncharacterized protein n=1 Tax=Reticulomyxa filosa TaxID=46433 RepID=X6NXR8_RETFI|nr:hypothetical protein RFI_07048 [Reticulomyxa filosa]|eukprot:ETO30072.1 hypothetical protein RFI_07048 [Reticulomyxa filosa]